MIYHKYYRLHGLSQEDYKLIMILKRLLFIIFFAIIYRKFKQILLFDTTYLEFISTLINKLIITITTYFIAIYFIKNKDILNTIKSALLISAILIIISMFLSDLLYNLGFSMRETEDQVWEIDGRYAGFYYGGDVNSVGVYLNFLVALFLFTLKDKVLTVYSTLIVIFLSIGIAVTGSRAALITLTLILIIFIITNSKVFFKSPRILFGVVILVVSFSFIALYLDVFSVTLSRLEDRGIMGELDPERGTGTRFLRWLMFIDYSFSSLFRLFLGNDSILYTNNLFRYRDVHNHFIHMLYFDGIIFLILYIYFIIKLQMIVIKNTTFIIGITLFFPFLLGGMMISNIKEITLYFMLTPLIITKMDIVQKKKLEL